MATRQQSTYTTEHLWNNRKQRAVQKHKGNQWHGTDLVVEVVEDASNSHLLEKLVLANTRQCTIVCTGPLAALHQDCQRRAVQQRCNGNQAEQVDAINVLQEDEQKV